MIQIRALGSVVLLTLTLLAEIAVCGSSKSPRPSSAGCHNRNVTYLGLHESEIEGFVGIRFAKDTGGKNRFKPPVPFLPASNSIIDAITAGPGCPQGLSPPTNGTPTEFNFADTEPEQISEDCLRLNVWRPNGTQPHDRLPVLVWIYGGGFSFGFKDDILFQPGGLILQSVANGHPIIHVELNYRLGVFGFAQSKALNNEGSENAGLRDQRLALEWVHKNIAAFGGDPEKVTIHGQSSGGLAVGMQLMAFGANQGFPFHQAICESQALEPGITGNFTREAMDALLASTSCHSYALDSTAALACLRNLPMQTLLNAQIDTSSSEPSANIGDQWLPVVDGTAGFLPAAPSELIHQRRFANATTMMGWTQDDANIFTPEINTANDTYQFARAYLPGFTEAHIQQLLSLYPVSDFSASRFPNGTVELSAEKYRAGRILRDIVFTCQPILYGAALSSAGNSVYYYDQNQTLLTPILEYYGLFGYGAIHTSELPYVFGNLSHLHQYDWPFHPSASDYALRNQQTRSWSSFTATGKPSLEGHNTLQGWAAANFSDETYGIYVIGGPRNGSSARQGRATTRAEILKQKLQKRCGFLNSPEIVKELNY